MNLASRPSSFFRSLLRHLSFSKLMAFSLSVCVLFAAQSVYAQPTPTPTPTPAPAAGAPSTTPTPATTPPAAPAAPAASASSAADISFRDAIAGASSFSCSGPSACLLNVVGFVITLIFSVISYFLSKLLIVLTSVLIAFARYNKFNNAPPVQIGWVIVRDVGNMFFIVVLLISAFMTIIGKAEDYGLHYKNVVPKLVVAAVLVNFSKMIILLMIDFSQVVMLTFISAFEGTIAGNLIQGFGVPQMTQLQHSAPGSDASAVATNLLNVCLAYILSIFLLTTAVATVLLYVGYFIFRIIAFWMVLIFSPMIFLASSIPGTAGGALKQATGDVWTKFMSILTGGPLIGFFLWLTFATIQQTASSGLAQAANMGFDFPEGTPSFLTQIGTAPQLASFIVAVAMMLMGFAAATKAASSIDGLSGMVNYVKKQKDAAFKSLSRAPWTMAKGAGRGVRAGANALDRRFGLTNSLASGIARGQGAAAGSNLGQRVFGGAGAAAGTAMRYLPGIGGALAAGTAGTLAARGAALKGAEKKKMDERIKNINNLPPAERAVALRELNSSPGAAMLMGPELIEAQHEALSKEENRKEVQKVLEKEEEEKLKKKELEAGGTLSDERKSEIGRQAKSLASARLAAEENERIGILQGYAKSAHDTARTAALTKEAKGRMLYEKDADYDKAIEDILNEPGTITDKDKSQMDSGKFALAMMRKAGVTDDSAQGFNALAYNDLREKFKGKTELLATLDVVAKQIQDGGASRATIEGASRRKDGFNEDRLYSGTGNGEAIYSGVEQAAKQRIMSGGGRTFGGALSEDHKAAFSEAIAAGLPMSMIMSAMDKKGADGKSDGKIIEYVAERAQSAVEKDRSKAIPELAELVKAAGAGTPDQRIEVAQAYMKNMATADKIFSNLSQQSGDIQKQGYALLTEARDLETVIQKKIDAGATIEAGTLKASEAAHMAQMKHLRENVFPESKITREIAAEIRVEKTGTMKKDEKGEFTNEEETREIVVKPARTVEVKAASSAARNILYS